MTVFKKSTVEIVRAWRNPPPPPLWLRDANERCKVNFVQINYFILFVLAWRCVIIATIKHVVKHHFLAEMRVTLLRRVYFFRHNCLVFEYSKDIDLVSEAGPACVQ